MDLEHREEPYTTYLERDAQQRINELLEKLHITKPLPVTARPSLVRSPASISTHVQKKYEDGKLLSPPQHFISSQSVSIDAELYRELSPEARNFVLAHEIGHLQQDIELPKLIDARIACHACKKKPKPNFQALVLCAQFQQKLELDADERAVSALKDREGAKAGAKEFFAFTIEDDKQFISQLNPQDRFLNLAINSILDNHPDSHTRLQRVQQKFNED